MLLLLYSNMLFGTKALIVYQIENDSRISILPKALHQLYFLLHKVQPLLGVRYLFATLPRILYGVIDGLTPSA